MRRIWLIAMLLLAAGASRAQDLTLSGFVDAAWFYDVPARAGEFGVDQVEVDLEHHAGERSLVRADLEWLKDGEGYLAQVEQAFMTYSFDSGWALSFGKFNAPIGVEALDPTEMFQYSHSLLFTYAAPTNLTGLKLARDLGGGVDVQAHLSNGWDRATADKHVTAGGRLGVARGGFSGGIGAISGREDPEGEAPDRLTRTVIDSDLTLLTGAWRICGEVNYGDVTMLADDAQWLGLLLMGHIDFSERAGLTLRLDQIDDQDGYLFGTVAGEFQTRRSLTVAPTFVLDEGLGALAELRVDFSDRDAFTDSDGLPTGSAVSFAVEMTYGW